MATDYTAKKILIVDDDPAYQMIFKTIVETKIGAKLLLAQSPGQAFEILRSESPDLIVLDMLLPNMDGKTALEHIRSAQATRSIPVIACTGLSDKSLIVDLARLGISSYIVKPFKIDEIAERVKKILDINSY